MDLTQIQEAVTKLSDVQQRQLAAFLTQLRLQRDPSMLQDLSRRLDDRNPANWIRLADAKKSSGES